MLTLSSAFSARATLNDTRKIILLHLYSDDESTFLKLASTSSVFDNEQYIGSIKSVSGATQKWNILDKNNVTISTPKITLIGYQTPNGYNLSSEFASASYYGRKFEIYFTYEGLSLADSLKIFSGITDDINFQNSDIIITGKTPEFPDVYISGRKLDSETQTIGSTSYSGTVYKIEKENNGETLNVIFGQHWCAPLQPYILQDTQLPLYALGDSEYSNLFTTNNGLTTQYQHNIGRTEERVMLLNEDFYVPIHKQGWTSDSELVFQTQAQSGILEAGVNLAERGKSGGHTSSQESIFLTVPTRYELVDGESMSTENIAGTSGDFEDCINQSDNSTGFVLTVDEVVDIGVTPVIPTYAWMPLNLSLRRNLKTEGYIVIEGRRISVPLTDSNDGQAYALGKYQVFVGSCYQTTGFAWPADGPPSPFIRIMHWKESYFGVDWNTPDFDDIRALGGSDVGTFTVTFLNASSTNNYNYMARVFDKVTTSASYTNIYESNNPRVGLTGTQEIWSSGEQGTEPFLDRDTVEAGDIGAAFYFYIWNCNGFGGQKDTTIHKFFCMHAGKVELKKKDKLYTSCTGVELDSSDSLLSTPQNVNDYILRRPYEYLEAILNIKVEDASFSSDWNYANINTAWESFYSGNERDYSGFVIDNPTLLPKFMKEIVTDEHFTCYRDENNDFNFKALQKTYVTGDKVGTLDYNFATSFSMSLTPTKNVIHEITELKTDFMYDIDDNNYVMNAGWRLPNTFDYEYYKFGNTYADNIFIKELIEKKHTSFTSGNDTVSYGGKIWSCNRSNTNNTPTVSGIYWTETTGGSGNAWSNSTDYVGLDEENKSLAEWYINMWANRHSICKFITDDLSYLRFQVGDVIEFSNVPNSLLGLDIKGFNGSSTYSVSVNSQTVYASFIVTEVTKSNKQVSITAMQLHDLTAYEVERI